MNSGSDSEDGNKYTEDLRSIKEHRKNSRAYRIWRKRMRKETRRTPIILTTGWMVVPFRMGGDHRRKSNVERRITLISRPVEFGCLCEWPNRDIQ